MKKILILILCSVSCAALAQMAPDPRLQRVRPPDGASKRSDAAAKSGGEAKPVVNGAGESAAVSSGNQENFDNIMGSFSDLAMKFSAKESSDLDVFVYECRYIGGKAFSQAMEPFLSVNGELSACADSDLVVISDERNRIGKLKEIAASIDRPVRQVLVSASVVEFQITDGFEKDLSLQYNQFVNMEELPMLPGGAATTTKTPASGFASRMMDAILPSGGTPSSLSGSSSYMYYNPSEQAIFSSFLTFLEKNGTAQILSSPSLILRRGHTGNILSGEDIPITKSNVGSGGTSYSVDYKSVGIKLRVTPQSIFDERVVLEVSPEVSNIIRYEESAAGRNPVVAIRNANTLLEMNDGYMVSIGGLLREEEIKTERRIPILGSIPLLGTLFRASTSETIRSQLVIFLSVKIVNPDHLTVESIDTKGVSEELQQQIDGVRGAFPVAEPSTFFGGFKKLFQ
jgi:type II secretory pathway component GspD/PulD (secretin)